MAQTDVEKAIERINALRAEGRLTQRQAQVLRNQARMSGTKKGALGASDNRALSAAIGRATAPAKTKDPEKQKEPPKPKAPPRPGYDWVWNGSAWIETKLGKDDKPTQALPEGYEWVWNETSQSWGFQQTSAGSGDGTGEDGTDTPASDPMAGQRETAKVLIRRMMEQLGFSESMGFTSSEINTMLAKLDEWIGSGIADSDPTGQNLLLMFRSDNSTRGIYEKRFPGMKAMAARGQSMSEIEYINMERQYRDTLSSFDLPPEYYDSFDDYGRFFAGGVSVAEVGQRAMAAKAALNPNVLAELQQYYGIGEGTATAYLLGLTDEKGVMMASDAAARNQRQLADINRNIQIGGMAEASGFRMGLDQASALSGTVLGQGVDPFDPRSQSMLKGTFDSARRVANRETVLAGIDREAYSEQDTLAAAFGDEQKKLASERRARRERARFAGSAGASSASLGVQRNI